MSEQRTPNVVARSCVSKVYNLHFCSQLHHSVGIVWAARGAMRGTRASGEKTSSAEWSAGANTIHWLWGPLLLYSCNRKREHWCTSFTLSIERVHYMRNDDITAATSVRTWWTPWELYEIVFGTGFGRDGQSWGDQHCLSRRLPPASQTRKWKGPTCSVQNNECWLITFALSQWTLLSYLNHNSVVQKICAVDKIICPYSDSAPNAALH